MERDKLEEKIKWYLNYFKLSAIVRSKNVDELNQHFIDEPSLLISLRLYHLLVERAETKVLALRDKMCDSISSDLDEEETIDQRNACFNRIKRWRGMTAKEFQIELDKSLIPE